MFYSQEPAFDIIQFRILHGSVVIWQMKDAEALSIDGDMDRDSIRIELKPFTFHGSFLPVKLWQPGLWHCWFDKSKYGWELIINIPSCNLHFYWERYRKPTGRVVL